MKQLSLPAALLLAAFVCVSAVRLPAAPRGADPAVAKTGAPAPAAAQGANALGVRIGIISYWDVPPSWPAPASPGAPVSCDPLKSTPWERVPANSLVVINPESGILERVEDKAQPTKQYAGGPVKDLGAWVNLARCLRERGVDVLGYVPTGYFDRRPCEKDKKTGWFKCQTEPDIRLQVKTYYDNIPGLSGIFFDETSRKTDLPPGKLDKKALEAAYTAEYALLRSINLQGRVSVFNVGTPSSEAVGAAEALDHLVLYESAPKGYDDDSATITALSRQARNKDVVVWHLLHSVGKGKKDKEAAQQMGEYVRKMAERCADYGYVTDIGAGKNEPTWNKLPRYWDAELTAFSNSKPSAGCSKQKP